MSPQGIPLKPGDSTTIYNPIVGKENFNHKIPPYNMMCTGKEKYIGHTRISSWPELKELWQSISKQGMWLWWELMFERDLKYNTAQYRPAGDAERRGLSRAYKELRKIGFIIRVKPQTYLLNPNVVVPLKPEYNKVADRWQFEMDKINLKSRQKEIEKEL